MPVIRQVLKDISAVGTITQGPKLSPTYHWEDLLWAGLTVGRRSLLDVFAFGQASLMEIVWRCAMIRANLDDVLHLNGRNFFEATPAFRFLDGSEKGAVSYFLGLMLAKLAAGDRLSVPWLLHLDLYSAANPYGTHIPVTVPTGTNSRPDLIGLAAGGGWLVCEAKGRTGSILNTQRVAAKEQTRMISTINRVAPSWRYASFARFSGQQMALAHEWIDPSDARDDAFPLTLSIGEFFQHYYRSISQFLRMDDPTMRPARPIFSPEDDREYLMREVPGLDIWIGLDSRHKAIELVGDRDFRYDSDEKVLSLFGGYTPPEPRRGLKVGSDGIAVLTGASWRRSNIPSPKLVD